ncbi:hypothetical protein YC2023_016358 [Brassica napus]
MRSRFLFQLGSIAVVSDARLKRDHQQLICISFLVFGVFRQCKKDLTNLRESVTESLERNLSTVSNDSLFSLSIGENLLTCYPFCPACSHIPVDSSDLGKSFDMEQKGIEVLGTDSEGSNSSVSWRNIGDCNNSPSSTQSVSYPM